MNRNLSALADKEYDTVIIGGGIFGACAAWDAVLRGLSVALVEKGDFCGGTSANSFKMVHGGIRYLQHADIVRIRQSCKERSALLRVAPHLVQPLPIAIPTYGHGKNGRALLSAGVFVYDFLTWDRNRGIKDSDRHIPWGRFLPREEVLELFPGLKSDNLTGAVLFHDGQMYNPTRLVISFLRSAVSAGAEAANYVEAVDFLCSSQRVVGIEVLDRLTGDRFQIRAKTVLNAAGPWAERLLEEQKISLPRKAAYSRDACFVVPRRLHHPYALAAQGRTRDPDAILSREARHLFVVPWRDYSLIGVWHVIYDGNPEIFTVTENELQNFIDEINWAYPNLNLTLDDALRWNAGLVPFGENQPGAVDLSYGKRSIVIDHTRQQGLEGLVTLIGVRYTTARGEAANAMDIIASKLKHRGPKPATDTIPIHGGRIDHFEAFVEQTGNHCCLPLAPKVMRALLHNYGSEYGRVLRYVEENSSWAETVSNFTVMKAEVVHAVREEMAMKLADVVFRRTDLATGEYPGQEALQICAELMGAELGWTAKHTRDEIEGIKQDFPVFCRKRDYLIPSRASAASS